jgi:hypothetical protein
MPFNKIAEIVPLLKQNNRKNDVRVTKPAVGE